MGQDSVDGVATCCCLGGPESNPTGGGQEIFFSPPPLGIHPKFLKWLPGLKAAGAWR